MGIVSDCSDVPLFLPQAPSSHSAARSAGGVSLSGRRRDRRSVASRAQVPANVVVSRPCHRRGEAIFVPSTIATENESYGDGIARLSFYFSPTILWRIEDRQAASVKSGKGPETLFDQILDLDHAHQNDVAILWRRRTITILTSSMPSTKAL